MSTEANDGREAVPEMTLADFVKDCRQMRYNVLDNGLFESEETFRPFLTDLGLTLGVLGDIGFVPAEGETYSLEMRLAIAELQSAASAMSAFELAMERLGLKNPRTWEAETHLQETELHHEATLLANALGRFIAMAHGL